MQSLKIRLLFLKKIVQSVLSDLQEDAQLSLRKVNLCNALHTEFSNQQEPVSWVNCSVS